MVDSDPQSPWEHIWKGMMWPCSRDSVARGRTKSEREKETLRGREQFLGGMRRIRWCPPPGVQPRTQSYSVLVVPNNLFCLLYLKVRQSGSSPCMQPICYRPGAIYNKILGMPRCICIPLFCTSSPPLRNSLVGRPPENFPVVKLQTNEPTKMHTKLPTHLLMTCPAITSRMEVNITHVR